jgi:hypothetical protein
MSYLNFEGEVPNMHTQKLAVSSAAGLLYETPAWHTVLEVQQSEKLDAYTNSSVSRATYVD